MSRLLLTGILLLLPLAAPALDSDRRQPLDLVADQARIDNQRGIAIYTGHVKVVQGTLHLWAERLETRMRNGEIQRILADGRPARYRQRPDGRQEDVTAVAHHMDYQADRGRLILDGGAEVHQGGDVFRSEHIVYDIKADRVQAGGSKAGERVHITIQPRERPGASPP